jgi:acetate kinase
VTAESPGGLVLVLNAGSSSLKYSLVDGATGATHASGLVEGVGGSAGRLTHRTDSDTHRADLGAVTHEQALRAALDALEEHGPGLREDQLRAVGHRMVHGGTRFSDPVLVTDEVVDAVRDLTPLAPLHNGANLAALEVAQETFPHLPHVAVFDTAFHQTIEPAAYTYAVPESWRTELGVRRYGFHGTSCAYVSREAARVLGAPLEDVNTIVLHLGNGASATAVRGGRSVETSMGMTPLEGLVMGTRSGDLDPAIAGYLGRERGLTSAEVERALNQESGLKGLAGDNDLRSVEEQAAHGDERARLALDVYCHRIRSYVGAYYAVLGTVQAVVFTAGVGENSAGVRAASLSGLERLGIEVDADRNQAARGTQAVVSTDASEVAVLVVPTQEEGEIARQALAVVQGG